MSSVKKLANAGHGRVKREREGKGGRAYECGGHGGALEGEMRVRKRKGGEGILLLLFAEVAMVEGSVQARACGQICGVDKGFAIVRGRRHLFRIRLASHRDPHWAMMWR
jgi:hypothetical protein